MARKKPVKTLQVEPADEAAIKAAAARFEGFAQESQILRVAIRIGLRALAKDYSPLGEPPIGWQDPGVNTLPLLPGEPRNPAKKR